MTEDEFKELMDRGEHAIIREFDCGLNLERDKPPSTAKGNTPPRAHKYNAQKTEVDGITFDSKKEASRYVELKYMEWTGEIQYLSLQPEYELQAAFQAPDGEKIRAIVYRADFIYWKNGHCIVEDVKGVQTPVFKIKAKMFKFRYPGIKLVIS